MEKRSLPIHFEAPSVGAGRKAVFKRLLGLHPPTPSRMKLVDLGCGPCIFARIARSSGYDVVAVDARDERVPDNLGDIAFVQSDVREHPLGNYDIVVALGLAYHLTLDDQLDLFSRVPSGALAIVDTQVHVEGEVPEEGRANLSPPLTDRGFEGVLYTENVNAMASIGNPRSFIHTPRSQERLFETTGFRKLETVVPHYVSKYGARSWYVAHK